MQKPYSEELVFAETEDGILQEGVVIRPAAESFPVPVVWIHGWTGRFSEPHAVRIGRGLASRGITFVSGSNRGHDFGSWCNTQGRESKFAGAGWELFSESPYDVAAWVRFAVGLGFPGVALLGHSYGGLKVGYYLGQGQDARVKGLIVASAPMWSRKHFYGPEWMKKAEELAAQGRSQELLDWGEFPPESVSAQTYRDQWSVNLDVFGSETPDPPVSRVTCPILAFFGTEEADVGVPADLEIIRRNATRAPRVDTLTFPGADHVYHGHEGEVAEAIANWVKGLTTG